MTAGARRACAALAALAVVSGCSAPGGPGRDPAPAPTTAAPPRAAPGSVDDDPPPAPTGRRSTELPPVDSPYSLPALMRKDLRSGRIERARRLGEDVGYTKHEVTYRSGGLRISGILLVPRGPGPFPAVVLAHGYIDPEVYRPGQGLVREQVALANAGYVVLHTDYRGHASSDPPEGPFDRETRLGYTEDVITAVMSLKREAYVDPDRVALLGRSMGGGIVYNVLVSRPGLVRAAVVYAAVSSRFTENLDRFTLRNRPEAAEELFAELGTPQESPEIYQGLSARTYFDRITEPVLLHHGTSDGTCPIRWSQASQRLLREAGVDSRLAVYPGERHTFIRQWDESMERTLDFLRERV